MTIRATAPVRLDFAGGWTDVAPFAPAEGGVVVNAAVELRAEVTLEPGGEGYRLEARDLGQTGSYPSAEFERDGRLDLLKAAVRLFTLPPCRLVTRSDAPPGSGLGSSGALDVALAAAGIASSGRRVHPEHAAEMGWQLEAVEAALPGGRQDQYAAALGGFHRFVFGEAVTTVPLALPAGFADWLERQVVVCYTGQSRVSSDTIARVMGRYAARDPVVTGALRRMKEVAETMALALEAGDAAAVGRGLSENWRCQCALDPAMRTDAMAALEAAMAGVGTLGGKAAGAGAGGTMFFLVGGDPAEAARRAAAAGARVLPLRWAREGVRVW